VTTVSLPAQVTAASGMDVLCHALESYTSVRFDAKPRPEDPMRRPAFCGSNPISDVWCEMALGLVGRYLRRAVMNGRDLEARYHMMLASTYAGTGFGNAGTSNSLKEATSCSPLSSFSPTACNCRIAAR